MEENVKEEDKVAAIQEDMDLMAKVANRLVQHNLDFSRLVTSMLSSRQLYAMCIYELERLCDETDFKRATKVDGEDNLSVGKKLTDVQSNMLREILINSAAIQAQNPFDENQLIGGMLNTTFPWMRDIVTKHNEAQEKLKKEAYESLEKERVAKPVTINLPINDPGTSVDLNRPSSLLFVGEGNAVRWLINKLVKELIAETSSVKQVLHLAANTPVVEDNIKYLASTDKAWEDCTSSNESFQRFYQTVMGDLSNPVDVLIVDELRNTKLNNTESFTLPVQLNDSQRRLKNWAKKAGCLLISCVCLERKLKDGELNLAEYETLRFHNIVRSVTTKEFKDGDKSMVKVLLGVHEVASIPAEELNLFAKKSFLEV